MFMVEHRYYGASKPTENMARDNMRYLSSRQCLEDLAEFVAGMNTAYNLTGPWISFGGSYAGALAAWLRQKFPHLVAGAVSSSGPLNAQLDNYEFLEVMADALATTGPGCTEAVEAAFKTIEELFSTGESGWEELSKMFLTCKSIDGTNTEEVAFFILLQVETLGQYNDPLSGDIKYICNIMRDEKLGSPIQRLAVLNTKYLESNGEECLNNDYTSFLAVLTETSWSNTGGIGMRQWIWQTCTEFGWYQTSNQPSGMFSSLLPLEFFESWCQNAFGMDFSHDKMDMAIKSTNVEYGGFFPQVENVVFVHGSIDPWHSMGVIKDRSENAPAIYINGTTHCADMYPNLPNDPDGLIQARARITQLVNTWIEKASKN
jgi:hypothetical protein